MTNRQESEEVRRFKATKIKAEEGYEDAQYNLGWMYAFGKGVPKNYKKAAKWFRKAAEDEEGYVQAKWQLGEMYYKGQGVPQDYWEAMKWFRKAAKQEVEAMKWFREEAEQGDDLAQFELGVMYSLGEGVPKNFIESYAWSLLAKANGHKEASQMISLLEEDLTAEQMEKGQARAAELHRLIEERKENPKPSVESP